MSEVVRSALVVGGGGGIGLAVSRRLLGAGFSVVRADVAEAQDAGEVGEFVAADVRDPLQVDRLYECVHEDERRTPEVVVVTAGVGVHERLDEGDPEKWRAALEVNLLGALRIARAFAPGMREGGVGDLVFISSVAARSAYPYGGAYSASKAGLEMAAETLRLELLPDVRVTTVAPGVVRTRFFERMLAGGPAVEEIGWGALEPDDVAAAVMYAIEQPRRVAVGTIVIRPAGQPF